MAGKLAGKAPYYLLPTKPFQLAPNPRASTPYLKALYGSLKNFKLKHVNRVEFLFDPFHPSIASIRYYLNASLISLQLKSSRELNYHFTSKRLQASNPKCIVKTSVATDRGEPLVKIKLG